MVHQSGLRDSQRSLRASQRGLRVCQRGLRACQRGLRACQRGLRACQRALRACQRGLRACQRGLRTCQRGLKACLEGQEGQEGGTDVRTYIRNFSPFYRTLSPVRAAAQKGLYLEVGIDGLNTMKSLQNPLRKISLSALIPDTYCLEIGKRIAVSK